MDGEGRARPRLGRFIVLGALVAFAVGLGAFGPQVWAAAQGGAFTRMARKLAWWRGIAQGSDPHIKRLVNNLGGPQKPRRRQ